MSGDLSVSELPAGDDAALQQLLDFASAHGTPRATSAAEYRDLAAQAAAHWTGFVARTGDEMRAVALAGINAAIGLDQVQLNAFAAPGDHRAFDAVLGAVDGWARGRSATHVTAHVSAPSADDLDAWQAAGYELVGERARVCRMVTAGDAGGPAPVIEGASITTLDERPDLEASAEQLWRIAHDDVPSALRFSAEDVPALRSELETNEGRAVAHLAVDAHDRVVGLALVVRTAAVAGHRMTATARDWRGRGVARALKVAAIQWAASNGVTKLQASNDAANVPMQAVNQRLDYQVEYRLVLLRRAVGSEPGV